MYSVRFSVLMSFLCFVQALSGQTITVSDKIGRNEDVRFHIIANNSDTTWFLRQYSDHYLLERFNAKMSIIGSTPIHLLGNDPVVINTASSKQGVSLLYYYVENGNTYIAWARYNWTLSKDSMAVIDTIPGRLRLKDENFILSEDKSKALAWVDLERYTAWFVCFDTRTGKRLWNQKILYQDAETNPDYAELLVDNSGAFYRIYNYHNSHKKKTDNVFNFVSYDGRKRNDFQVTLGPYNWVDVKFDVDNLNHKLTGGGVYSEGSSSRSDGLFFISADNRGTGTPTVAVKPFTPAFIQDFTGKEPTKRSMRIADLQVQQMILLRDGGVVFMFEEYRKYTRQVNNYPMYTRSPYSYETMTDYYYDNILLFSIAPDGQERWNSVLRKHQSSTNDHGVYSSAFVLKTRNALRFLYNDDVRYGTPLYEYVLNAKGENTRNMLTPFNAETHVLPAFHYGKQVNANTVIAPSIRQGEFKLVRIAY